MDKLGNTIDFYLSSTRNAKTAKRILGKALRGLKEWERPEVLNIEEARATWADLQSDGSTASQQVRTTAIAPLFRDFVAGAWRQNAMYARNVAP